MSTQPKIDVFVTSILSSTAIRSRHERVIRHLSSARIEFTTHDVCEENAKKYWKLKSGGNNELPCLLVDGERVGSCEDLDEAVEFGELKQFLRLNSPPPPSTSTLTPSSTSAELDSLSYTAPNRPTPTIDDFSELNLTEQELLDLEIELNASNTTGGEGGRLSFDNYDLESKRGAGLKGFISDSPEAEWSSKKYTPIQVNPLSFSRSRISDIGRDKDEIIERKSALPEVKVPLGDIRAGGGRDDFDGIELTEEEARQLLRDLGLDDETEEDQTTKEEVISTSPSQESIELESLSKSTSVEGGASLSAPLSEVEELHHSPAQLVSTASTIPTGSKLEVEPISQFEIDALKTAKLRSTSSNSTEEKEEEIESNRGQERRVSSVEQVQELKKSLNKDVGDTGNGSSSIPVVGKDMDEKIVRAIREGLI